MSTFSAVHSFLLPRQSRRSHPAMAVGMEPLPHPIGVLFLCPGRIDFPASRGHSLTEATLSGTGLSRAAAQTQAAQRYGISLSELEKLDL